MTSVSAVLKEREEQLDTWESKLVAKQEDLNTTLRGFREEMARSVAHLKDMASQLATKEIALQQREKEVAKREKTLLDSMAKFQESLSKDTTEDDEATANTASALPPQTSPRSEPVKSPPISPSRDYQGKLDVDAKLTRSVVEELSDSDDEKLSPGGTKKREGVKTDMRPIGKHDLKRAFGDEYDDIWTDDDDDDDVFLAPVDKGEERQAPVEFDFSPGTSEEKKSAFYDAVQVFTEMSNISAEQVAEMLKLGALSPEQIINFASCGPGVEMTAEEEGAPEDIAEKERIIDTLNDSTSSSEEVPRVKRGK